MLFVDGGNNRVGVGTNLPTAPLEINAQAGGLGGYTALKIKYGTSSVQSLSMGQVTAGNGAFLGTAQYRSGGNWQTESTAASVIDFGANGNLVFYTNSGLTANTDYTPTSRLSLNTTEAVFNDPSADYDFRVESDANTHMLFVDGGNNKVSVGGTNAEGDTFAVINSGAGTGTLRINNTNADANPTHFVIQNSSATPADNDGIGTISFIGKNDAGNDNGAAYINVIANDVTNGSYDATLEIQTLVAGSVKSRIEMTPTETIFNEDSVDLDFRVESDGNANMLVVDGGDNSVRLGKSGGGVADAGVMWNDNDLFAITTTCLYFSFSFWSALAFVLVLGKYSPIVCRSHLA
jgi:hypothetical protein